MVNPLSNAFYLIPPLVAFVIGIILSILILRKSTSELANRLFSLALIGLCLWGLFIFAMRISPDVEHALFWDRMAVPAGIAMFVFYYHFTSVYTHQVNRKLVWAAYSFLVVTYALFANGLVISHMSLEVYGYAPHFYPAMYLISAGGALCLVGALLNLIRAFRAATHHDYRTRLTYMIIAIIVLFSFGILDIFPKFPPFGIFGNIIFGILTAVAILKYHLLDINFAVRRGLAYFLMSSIVAIPYLLVVYLYQQILIRPIPIGVLVVLFVVTAFAFNRIWQRVECFVDRRFYRQRYDFLKALEQFSRETHDITDLEQLGSSLVRLIAQALQAASIYLLLPSESGDFNIVSSARESAIRYTVKSDSPVLGSLRSNKALLYCQDKDPLLHSHFLTMEGREELQSIGAELFVPIKDKKAELVGLLLLGKKLSGQPYSYEDEQLILTVASRIAIEVENAQLYEQVRRSEKQMRDSEMLFRTIVEAGPSFLMIVNVKGTVIYASPNCEQFTGYTQEELQGKVTWWTHENDFVRITTAFNAAFNAAFNDELSEGTNIEFKAVKKNGELWYASASWRLLKDWKEQVKSVVVQIVDITERKQMEAEKRDMEKKAEIASRLASVGEMASGIAHEINNPLTGVIGFCQLLLKKDIPEDIRGNVETIRQGSQRVASIISRLLTFARQYKPERNYVNINEIIENTLALQAYEMETNNIELTTQLDPKLPRTMGDSGQLQQVFLNIVMNAETEMKSARGRGKLFVKTERIDNNIRISFKDDGAGITTENLKKVFNPFFTTREVGKGTGLGLSLCHGIVSEHSGRIYAKSQLGKGSTFIVELPIVVEEKQELTESADESERIAGGKILVVDDEPTILQFLNEELTDEGYEVETVDNAGNALEMIRSGKYDLILLDIKLPGMSGIELYKWMQKTRSSLARRVVFITGDVMGVDTKKFLSRTKAHYLAKPFDTEQLKTKINQLFTDGA